MVKNLNIIKRDGSIVKFNKCNRNVTKNRG